MLADKGYDSDDVRASLLLKGILPVIPPKANRKEAIACDFRACKDRNRVERMFNKLLRLKPDHPMGAGPMQAIWLTPENASPRGIQLDCLGWETAMQDVLTYLESDFKNVEGWCSPWLWKAINLISGYQDYIGLSNPLAEIGVYHGKFLIPLILTRRSLVNNYAIDVFDMQQFNLDGAGEGNIERLKTNMAIAGIPQTAVEILKADSTALPRDKISEIRQITCGFSMFSIDGCHTLIHTLNDIEIAMELTHEGGVIFIDDFESQHWPEVSEAVARLYIQRTPKFVPLCVLHNKLILAHISHHHHYLNTLVDNLSNENNYKKVRRYGFETVRYKRAMTRVGESSAERALALKFS